MSSSMQENVPLHPFSSQDVAHCARQLGGPTSRALHLAPLVGWLLLKCQMQQKCCTRCGADDGLQCLE